MLYSISECLDEIRKENDRKDNVIKFLRNKIKRLEDESYKDTEIQRLHSKLVKMEKDYYRGFPISEEEDNAIKQWQKRHEEEAHSGSLSGGCIGGTYSYKFTPTSIGVSGVVRCICGAEFEFKELG